MRGEEGGEEEGKGCGPGRVRGEEGEVQARCWQNAKFEQNGQARSNLLRFFALINPEFARIRSLAQCLEVVGRPGHLSTMEQPRKAGPLVSWPRQP